MLIVKTTAILIGLTVAMGLCGCAAHFKYEPGRSILPIDATTKVTVRVKRTEGFPNFPNLEEEIKSAIVKDLQKNVFPLLSEVEPDVHATVDVELLKFQRQPWGFLWLPLVYFGVPADKFIGTGEVSLSIAIYRTGTLIATYSSSRRLEKWAGLYWGQEYNRGGKKSLSGLALREAMDDIKSQIERDRSKILQRVREEKDELPPTEPPTEEEPPEPPIAKEPAIDVEEIPDNSLTKLENGLCVIFGIEDYRYAPGADFAERDATTFHEYAKSVFGIPERNIYFQTNENATKGEFDKIFVGNGWLARRVKRGESDVIFYFSGHGAPDINTQRPYIVPWDIDPNFAHTALPIDKIYENLSGLGAKSVTIFLDACFSGQSKGKMVIHGRPLMPVQIEAPSADITVFTASPQISSVYSEKKHGLFTYYLLKGLQGYGDLNGDKEIRVGELSDYVKNNVSREARHMDREQVPQLLSGDRERVLVRMR